MPETTPSTPKPSTRARGSRPRGGIQRKSKAEREQFAKEEAERNKARAAEHEAATRGARDGRRVVNRGRGAAVSGPRQAPVGSGGVFGGGGGSAAATGAVKPKYEGFAELLEGGASSARTEGPSQGDAGGGGGTRGKGGGPGGSKSSGRAGASKGGNASGASAPTVGETLETTTDDEPDDGPKRDIERIWISSEEDDDVVTSTSRKGKQKATNTTARRPSRSGPGLRPVRAPRTLREEEEQTGQGTNSRKKRTSTTKRPDIEPQEVSSDERDGDAMDVDREDSVQVLKERPSSPELRKRTGKKGTGTTSKHGPLKALANGTIEDRAERLRVQDDVEKLREVFVSKPSTRDPLDEDEEELEQRDDGTLLLFQLPPLTPFLTDPGALSPDVKPEPPSTANATIDLDTIPDAPPPPTDGPSLVNLDPETDTTSTNRTLQLDSLLTASEPIRLPAGMVGKLKVHKSGKVTLDWGGTDMEVRLGSEVDFLQDVVLVQPPGRDAPDEMDGDGEKGERKGRAFALGHVRHKMVLIPDWAKLYD